MAALLALLLVGVRPRGFDDGRSVNGRLFAHAGADIKYTASLAFNELRRAERGLLLPT